MLFRSSHAHRPHLAVVFGNLDHAWAMFRFTMVTSYPGQSGPPWPGELVIGSTITYRGEGKWVSPYGFVVGEWAYVKELAATNTRMRGE